MDLEANPVLLEILKLFRAQQQKGLLKYGKLVELDAYTVIGWIEHHQQELIDALVYTEAIKQKLKKENPS
jgi:hypothetical protein